MIAHSNSRFSSQQASAPSRHQAWDIAYESLAEEGLLKDDSQDWKQRASRVVGRYPLFALGAAAAVGIVAGCWVKRSGR